MKVFWFERAWVNGKWQGDVLLKVNALGYWQTLEVGISESCLGQRQLESRYKSSDSTESNQSEITKIRGAVIPGLTNAHSHAFQRAIAGLTERSESSHDDFWSWRQHMYAVALQISPTQLEVIATQLYRELLAGGYTHVCEFNYLHRDEKGAAYSDPLEFSMALIRAAKTSGIGLTVLPTLYMRSGFGKTSLREDQRRFTSTPDEVFRLAESINEIGSNQNQNGETKLTHVNAGIALHSLRAVNENSVKDAAHFAHKHSLPVHIHIAEQIKEVEDCVAHNGCRPVEWLLDKVAIDARWNLVHATHTTADELTALKHRNSAIVICPTTEANLGDGVFDLPTWLKLKGTWSIGSDSHVTRDWREELRLLEYSQRLQLKQRNIASRFASVNSTSTALFQATIGGASAATALPLNGIAVGQRADFCVVDHDTPALAGVPNEYLLDALVFSSPSRPFKATYVGGCCVYKAEVGTNSERSPIDNFSLVMGTLWRK
jgi:formimidoylglutamate deiminase